MATHHHQHSKLFSELLSFKPDLTEEVDLQLFGLESTQASLTRKDESTLTDAEKSRFVNSVKAMMASGVYQDIVAIHADMSHNMHGSMGRLGLNRFLAWHRRYLIAFEQEIRKADTALTGIPNSNLAVPYWRWSVNREFPAWLLETTPAFGEEGPDSSPVSREIGVSGILPSEHDVSEILANYAIRSGLGDQFNEYEKFTYCLEGWGDNLPAHNHVHVWVGGIMNNTSYSPSDPIFWLHHCEIDRLWWVWQQSHSNVHPSASRERLQLTPWTESNYYSVIDIKTIGYSYDRVSP